MKRWIWWLRNFRGGYHELNRRAKVEAEMWDCVNSKTPMPDVDTLRRWAIRLGVPEEFQINKSPQRSSVPE